MKARDKSSNEYLTVTWTIPALQPSDKLKEGNSRLEFKTLMCMLTSYINNSSNKNNMIYSAIILGDKLCEKKQAYKKNACPFESLLLGVQMM